MELLSSNSKINSEDSNDGHFLIRDKDTGSVFDLRKTGDVKVMNDKLDKLANYNLGEDEKRFYVECYKLNQKIKTKFFKYCESGDISKIKQVLDKRKSPDLIAPINEKYMHGYTVLHVAVSNNSLDVIDILLDHGADLEAQTSIKRTPFQLSVLKNFYSVAKLLASCGCNINAQDNDNNTALHLASRNGNEGMVDFLLSKKAKVDLKNNMGQTPIDIVCNYPTYKVFIYHLGEEAVKSFKSEYTRLVLNKVVFHNSRHDNIREIMARCEKYSQRRNVFNLDGVKNFSEFNSELDLESFRVLEPLGKGSFGEVYLVEHKQTNKKYALKVLNKHKLKSQNIIRYIITERNVLSKIKHPFIVELYYAFQTNDFLYLILEYCPNGDLSSHLRKEKFFEEDKIRLITAQIVLAIEELHKHNIIYRDLKPENLVLDEFFFIKLTDFGLSKEGIKDNTLTKSFCGSLAYLAPEVLNRQGHGKAVDWYLLGVLIYEMFFGFPPYYTNTSKEALFYNIRYGKLAFPGAISLEAKSLILNLLNRNPLKRLGSGLLDADEVKAHPFFKDLEFELIYMRKFLPPIFCKDIDAQLFMMEEKNANNFQRIETDIKKKTSQDKKVDGWTFIHP